MLQGNHRINFHTRGDVGRRWSLYSCSMGKAILAALPDEEAHNIILERGLARCTERTTTMEPALRQMLAQIRKKGYSTGKRTSRGSDVPQPALQAPCDMRLGHLVPSVRITEQNIAEYGVQAVETADAISESLRAM